MEKVIRDIVNKILKQKIYPAVSFSSYSEVENIVRYYMTIQDQFSKATSSDRKFQGADIERTKFLGSDWVRAIYQKIAGAIPTEVEIIPGIKQFIPPKDFILRDKIWICLNLIMQYAKEDAYYMVVWDYYRFKNAPAKAAEIIKAEVPKPVAPVVVVEPKETGIKKYLPVIAIGVITAKVMKVI